ncbi:MAG: serine/threonine-protein kinase [Planctomycetota bacterium]
MGEELKPGERIGNYRIIETVGKGGMGYVYKARQISMDRIVALKVLHLRTEKMDPQLRNRFVNEARTAGKLNHENIIPVHDVSREGEVFFFSMDYIEGESVGDLLDHRGRLEVRYALAIARGVLKALIAASKLGIIHRDIKPDNIIIARDGVTKLADLGLAKQADLDKGGHITQDGVVMGTPHYMSPEQAQGRDLDSRTDIYSLGATLFHMLTGRTPFLARNSLGILSEVVKNRFPRPADVHPAIPDRVSALVIKMMAGDPAFRYATPEEVLAEIAAIERSIAAHPLSTALIPLRRRWRLAVVLSVLAIAAAMGAGFLFRPYLRPAPPVPVVPVPAVHVSEPAGPPAPVVPVAPVRSTAAPFLEGVREDAGDGRVRLIYNFELPGELADWYAENWWRQRRLREEARLILTRLQDRTDIERLAAIRARYLAPPPAWRVEGGGLANVRPDDIEGCVHAATLSGDVEVTFLAEVRLGTQPAVVIGLFDDAAGNGVSINLGEFSLVEHNMLVVTRDGVRERVEPIPLPVPLAAATVYAGRIVRAGDQVRFWFSAGTAIDPAAPPLVETRVPDQSAGHLVLWSNRVVVKFHAVTVTTVLHPLDRAGWTVRSGAWTAADPVPVLSGRAGAPARLAFRGPAAGHTFRFTGLPPSGPDAMQVFSLDVPPGTGIPPPALVFGLVAGSVRVQTAPSDLPDPDAPPARILAELGPPGAGELDLELACTAAETVCTVNGVVLHRLPQYADAAVGLLTTGPVDPARLTVGPAEGAAR